MEIEHPLSDGEIVRISIDDSGSEICVTDSGGVKVGRLCLDVIESANGSDEYFLTWAYMDLKDPKYKRQGIGRTALKLHHELFSAPIYARSHDGQRYDDGSHLTGDAPAFVAAMRDEGLIEPDSTYADFD